MSRRVRLAAAVAVIVGLTGALLASAPASADTIPSNPDRIVEPVIAGTKVNVPFGSCTVGAVLVPKSIFSRITTYQRAVRWLVLAKHCAPMYATVSIGSSPLGNVVWRSATSDIELVRVSPRRDTSREICYAHSNSPATCSPFVSYTPRASGQVFARSAGRIARVPINGSADPDGRFCTSGWASGVQCVWHGIAMPPNAQLAYQHLAAADADELTNLAPGDSGGPVVSYSNQLLGIISSNFTSTTIMLYTPIRQVLTELFSYELAPAS
ncbi:trypsin-like serine protease [Curtobacterium flaccumfaciens]|uniref:trypsin-like serine protease n=1 Tax=Curtobacterium flaccumfaciens TaxID=2035 RepID=UPI0032AF9E38